MQIAILPNKLKFSMEMPYWGQANTNQNQPPKLLEQVRLACLRRRYSPRTATSYMSWCRQFILFHHKRHPKEMGKADLEAYLNSLVTKRRLSASSQSQALNALFFMYRHVLEMDTGWLENLARVKRKQFLPTVLSMNEVREVLFKMISITRLMAELIYGTGMRVNDSPVIAGFFEFKWRTTLYFQEHS